MKLISQVVLLFCLNVVSVFTERKFDEVIIEPTVSTRILSQQDVETFDPQQPPQTDEINEKSEIADKSERRNVFFPHGPPLPGPGYPGPGVPPGLATGWLSLTLELTPGTRLTVRPGESARLNYELVNMRDAPQAVGLSAIDTLGLIRAVLPPRVLVPPRGISRVTVELFPTRDGAEGLVNTVTLIGQSSDGGPVSRAALIRVTNEKEEHDSWAPHCSFSVPWGQCRDTTTLTACGAAGWNAEVTVTDDLSGILRVESSHPGNLVSSKYTAGTRAPVTLLMSASCCQESMQIRVWDAMGNSRTCDAYVYGLTPAEIAAICLGVLLLIALIILIVLACLLCRRRRSEKLSRRELPRHGDR